MGNQSSCTETLHTGDCRGRGTHCYGCNRIFHGTCRDGYHDVAGVCWKDADSFALWYTPISRNSTYSTPAINIKPQRYRGPGNTPKCRGDLVEYGSALGSCYEDCNITAHENGYDFLQPKVNGKYPRDSNDRLLRKPGKDWVNWTMKSAGLCSLECPSGYSDGGAFCNAPSKINTPNPLECSGRWQQYGLQCYTPCNETAGVSTWDGTKQVKKSGYEYVNYQMQSAGLCSQQCPDGASDGGVFCNRQKYSRGAGQQKPYRS
jgi:hypothetical protein